MVFVVSIYNQFFFSPDQKVGNEHQRLVEINVQRICAANDLLRYFTGKMVLLLIGLSYSPSGLCCMPFLLEASDLSYN